MNKEIILYYLKTPNNEIVNFDRDSGGYPYFSPSLYLPWFTRNENEAKEKLQSYLSMKLLPVGTKIFSVDI